MRELPIFDFSSVVDFFFVQNGDVMEFDFVFTYMLTDFWMYECFYFYVVLMFLILLLMVLKTILMINLLPIRFKFWNARNWSYDDDVILKVVIFVSRVNCNFSFIEFIKVRAVIFTLYINIFFIIGVIRMEFQVCVCVSRFL